MKLSDHIYLVVSGSLGISDPGDCHIYLLDGGSELALIDVGNGSGVEQLIENISRDGLDINKLRYVLLTHAHADHAKGYTKLKTALKNRGITGIKIATSSEEARLLSDGTAEELGLDLMGLGNISREESYPPFSVDIIIQDGQSFNVGNIQITAIQVRGHNPGCICYLTNVDGKRVLFSGDVIYPGGVISLGNWIGTDLLAYRRELTKLTGLNIDSLLPGHLLWTMRNGQEHIDKANRAFTGLFPPPNISQIP